MAFMSDVENLILEHLRQIRAGNDALREDMREVKTRLGHLEDQIGELFAQLAGLRAQ